MDEFQRKPGMDEFRPQGGDLQVKEGHQEVDFSVRVIVWSAALLVIAGIAVLILSVFIQNGLEWWEKKHDAQLTPMQERLNKDRAIEKLPEGIKPPPDWDERAQQERHLQKTFPTPRLQYDDARDMNQLLQSEEQWLATTGKNSDGTVHIPISRAIELLSKEGLPQVSGPFVPSVPLPVEPVTSTPENKSQGGTKPAGK